MNKKQIIAIIISSIIFLILLLQKSKLTIYTLDADTEKIIIHSYVSVLKISPTDKQLSHLASKLSKELFNGKSIVLQGIKNENGKEIASFDLQDTNKDISSPDNWYSSFQGSSGAYATLTSITETLLQKEFKGNWIDGIRLTYNGEYAEFDHVNFEDRVYWRK